MQRISILVTKPAFATYVIKSKNTLNLGRLYLDHRAMVDLDDLAIYLKEHEEITQLDLTGNDIDDKGAEKISRFTTIKILDLSANPISDQGAEALSKNETFEKFILRECHICKTGVQALARNSKLAYLDLSFNKIKGEQVQQLSDVTTIKMLNLSGNPIGQRGVEALSKNQTFEELILSACKIDKTGVIALAGNSKLVSLDLSYNNIKDKDALLALANNITLKKLNLRGNFFGDEGALILARNTTLAILIVEDNKINTLGSIKLAENQTFEELDMRGNLMGIVGAAAFSGNRALKKLMIDVQHNGTDAKYVPALQATLKLNPEFQNHYILKLIELLNQYFPNVLSTLTQQYADKEFPHCYHKEEKLSSSALSLFHNPLRQHPNMIIINAFFARCKKIKENKENKTVTVELVQVASITAKEIQTIFDTLIYEFNRGLKKTNPHHVDITVHFSEDTGLLVLKNIDKKGLSKLLKSINTFLDKESNLLIEAAKAYRC